MERASAVLAAHLTPTTKRIPATRQGAQPLPLVSSLAPPWLASPLQPRYSCADDITIVVITQVHGQPSDRPSGARVLDSAPREGPSPRSAGRPCGERRGRWAG